MPQHSHFDAIIIGSGPGGEGAAMGLVKQGAGLLSSNAITTSVADVLTGEPSLPKHYATPSAESSNLTKTRSTVITPAL